MNNLKGKTMRSTSKLRLIASALVVGSSMMLASVSGQAQGADAGSETRVVREAQSFAVRASKALVKKNAVKAAALAERAVELEGRNADYRMLLGQTYLAAGRFQSAEQAFADTLTLNPEKERAALNLSLAQVALGKYIAAQSTLADYRDKLAAADFGLALALAGNPQEAVQILEFATRAPDATAKTRQNLALAYALAGKWTNAKVMAVQDITPDEADARLAVWAGFARPGGGPAQVAALLGVKPAADSGLPTRLALSSPAAAVAVAAVEVPAVQSVEAPVAIADTTPTFETPAPAEPAKVQPVVVAAAPAPALIRADPQPARQAVKSSPQRTVSAKPAMKPVAAPVGPLRNASVQRTKSGKFVVQLGAFQTAASAQRAWNRISSRVDLSNYEATNGATKLRNASLVRVSVGSFGQRADADRMCARIKKTGNVCFVRVQEGDAPARWAQNNSFKVASR